MTDTTVIAAYAAQYAKACKTEPRVGFDENGLGKPYTYMLIDDITPFMAETDTPQYIRCTRKKNSKRSGSNSNRKNMNVN